MFVPVRPAAKTLPRVVTRRNAVSTEDDPAVTLCKRLRSSTSAKERQNERRRDKDCQRYVGHFPFSSAVSASWSRSGSTVHSDGPERSIFVETEPQFRHGASSLLRRKNGNNSRQIICDAALRVAGPPLWIRSQNRCSCSGLRTSGLTGSSKASILRSRGERVTCTEVAP